MEWPYKLLFDVIFTAASNNVNTVYTGNLMQPHTHRDLHDEGKKTSLIINKILP